MRNIDITISFSGFQFMHKHCEKRDAFSRGNPLYCLYYRHKDGSLGSVVLSIYNLSLLVTNHCSFRTYKDKVDFEYFINSLKGIPIESNTINYRWRLEC